jgi:hypothetical protein
MKKTFCAGVFALAAIGLLPGISAANADEFVSANSEQQQMSTAINVGRIKRALRLTVEQEPYWPPVEAALRNLVHQQAHTESAGVVRRISHQVVSLVLSSAAIERLAVAARPLIVRLNEDQMRAASGLAQEMGLGPVVMAAMK